jgi:Leucine-rich repeat (LRR) protein
MKKVIDSSDSDTSSSSDEEKKPEEIEPETKSEKEEEEEDKLSSTSSEPFNPANEIGWEKSFETLAVNHMKISRITCLEGFISLRRLALIDNDIQIIENLGSCKLLEELSLEKNKI